MKTINKRNTVYYTRVFPETGTYDLCDLVIRTVMDNWFCGVDKKDKRAYLLGFNEIDENVFDGIVQLFLKEYTMQNRNIRK